MGASGQKASEIDIRLEDMRQVFLIRLAEKGFQIHEILIEINTHGPRGDLRDAIACNAHQTVGVAPSYGYAELGDTARKVEAAWSAEFSPERLDRAKALTDEYLDMVEAVLYS